MTIETVVNTELLQNLLNTYKGLLIFFATAIIVGSVVAAFLLSFDAVSIFFIFAISLLCLVILIPYYIRTYKHVNNMLR